MDDHSEIREFLRTRRDRITPEQAGIGGGHRRVPGLRREEVAFLAGVSVDYYARLERGNLAGVSDEVLAAIGRVLRLDEAETTYLGDLADAAQRHPATARRKTMAKENSIRPSLQRFLDSITGSAVWIRNERMDFIAGNALGRAVYAPVMDDPSSNGGNNALFAFLSPAARNYYTDWEKGADDVVASLRLSAGKNPRDKDLSDLIGRLVTRSDEFSRRWASHNVRFHRSGLKRLRHPLVGDLELTYEAMHLPENPGWTMFAFTAEPGTPSDERLKLLGSLTADAPVTDAEATPTGSTG